MFCYIEICLIYYMFVMLHWKIPSETIKYQKVYISSIKAIFDKLNMFFDHCAAAANVHVIVSIHRVGFYFAKCEINNAVNGPFHVILSTSSWPSIPQLLNFSRAPIIFNGSFSAAYATGGRCGCVSVGCSESSLLIAGLGAPHRIGLPLLDCNVYCYSGFPLPHYTEYHSAMVLWDGVSETVINEKDVQEFGINHSKDIVL